MNDVMVADGLQTERAKSSSWDPVQKDFIQLNIKANNHTVKKKIDSDYNVHEIPKTENGGPLRVEVSVSLRNILEIDEHKQLLTIETTMRLYWTDPRLTVRHLLKNSSLDYILLHPNAAKFIWFPDIYIDFAKDLRLPTYVTPPASLRIYRNSTIRYATQVNYDVACPMTFHKYPYDTQECKVKFESYGHTVERMTVAWKQGLDKSKVTDNNSISLAQFEYDVFFEENYEEEIASGVYPGVIMKIVLKRNINYHLLQTYLPSGIFVVVAWLSLFLPAQSIPGRITMAMTTLLTLASMFGAVRQSTPKVSYVSALDIWMCTCIIFVFFALLEYVIVLALIQKYGKLPTVSSKRIQDAPNNIIRCKSFSATDREQNTKVFCSIESPSHINTKRSQDVNVHVKKRSVFGLCRRNRRKRVVDEDSAITSDADGKTNPFIKFERICSVLMAVLFICFNGLYWTWLLGYVENPPHFQH